MNEFIEALLMGCGIGIAIHDPVCNFMNRLHDRYWEDKMAICKNCKWYVKKESENYGKCHNPERNYVMLVADSNFCGDWEEPQK